MQEGCGKHRPKGGPVVARGLVLALARTPRTRTRLSDAVTAALLFMAAGLLAVGSLAPEPGSSEAPVPAGHSPALTPVSHDHGGTNDLP